ncbi:stigma-specific STIG1-like protein 2 [Cynara cardunculus var. scolymus]|uniref:Stigma-specific protein Stig1 n=1 Tax=Cynara cardunculus var. scolymus TaxID=59895 RepID=A0A103Y3M1_CYNCS|nr:stigma-specific STIG1-like protein 2 [Cynara cardunculus var. scolymus]KVI01925.1 Stigma-specific protein Stig1 [Cynara cardunculus var. scolymus]
MSKMIKTLFMIVITVAITITLTFTSINNNIHKPTLSDQSFALKPFPKRLSRFLAETKNPRSADHCNKDNEICYILEGINSTCCNNKCMDLSQDKHNCGACKNKCKFTSSCCRGECVTLAYDKRNCGSCDNKCMHGGYCIYGLCNYA